MSTGEKAPLARGREAIEVCDGSTAIEVAAVFGGSLLDVRHYGNAHATGKPGDFRIGTAPECDLHVAAGLLPVAAHSLVHSTGVGQEVWIAPGMQGEMVEDGAATRLADLVTQGRARPVHPAGGAAGAHALDLRPGQRLRVDLGLVTLHLAAVPPPRRHRAAPDPDWGFLTNLGGVLLGAAVLVALMLAIPPGAKTLSGSTDDDVAQYGRYLVAPPRERQPDVEQRKDSGGAAGAKGGKAAGAEGKMGNRKAPDTGHRYGIQGPADNQDIHLARRFAEEDAQRAGVLGFLAADAGVHGPTSLFGQDRALGNDAENALGNLVGDEVGDAFGADGLGWQKTGPGGGGIGETTFGIGNLDTVGTGGNGPRGRRGFGTGVDGLHARHAGGPIVVPGHGDVRGALDPDTIRRVVHYHLSQVKFCYDQELQKHPTLAGREVVAFTIAPDGSVVAARTVASMGDALVDQCVVEAIRRLEFPKPEGGGIVQVRSYPFVLSAQ